MKKVYYLLILVLVSLVSCDNVKITKHAADIYLYNHLDETIKIEVFNADGMLSCEVAPNDTAFFTTIDFTSEEDVIYEVYPGELAYNNFVLGINRVTLYYGTEKYTYSKENKNDIIDLLYLERYWEIHFDEAKRQQFGWEANIEEDVHTETRHVSSVYLVNHLDKPIELEMHYDSIPLPIQEELLWYRNAGVQNFTLQPNDTVYCDSVVYSQIEDVVYFTFPGQTSYDGFVNSYFFIKINYNNQQYEYTNKTDIQNLLCSQNYWYIVFNEEKKNTFGWE